MLREVELNTNSKTDLCTNVSKQLSLPQHPITRPMTGDAKK